MQITEFAKATANNLFKGDDNLNAKRPKRLSASNVTLQRGVLRTLMLGRNPKKTGESKESNASSAPARPSSHTEK